MSGVLTNKNLQWCEPFNQLLSGGEFWQTWIKLLLVIHLTVSNWILGTINPHTRKTFKTSSHHSFDQTL